jgi:hypothetical protein
LCTIQSLIFKIKIKLKINYLLFLLFLIIK